jgi:hypothetical protein
MSALHFYKLCESTWMEEVRGIVFTRNQYWLALKLCKVQADEEHRTNLQGSS